MALKRYIEEVGGQTQEAVPVNTGGAGKEEQIVATDTNGLIDASLMPAGIGADTASIVASETLVAGDFVNIWDDAGTPKVRKAIAEDGKTADGFVLDNVTAAASATVYFEGKNTTVNKEGGGLLTGGTSYFLSDATAGTVTETAPSASTKHVQRLGKAYSTSTMTTEGMSIATIKKA
jgi:hypothetical protein